MMLDSLINRGPFTLAQPDGHQFSPNTIRANRFLKDYRKAIETALITFSDLNVPGDSAVHLEIVT